MSCDPYKFVEVIENDPVLRKRLAKIVVEEIVNDPELRRMLYEGLFRIEVAKSR